MTHLPAIFRLRPLAAAVMAAAFSSGVGAVPVNWVPNADGFWDVGANWSSSPALPGAADDVTIDVGGATVRTTTFRSGNQTINSLVSEENLALTGGTLTINSASTISAGFTHNGGFLAGAGNLTVAGASELGTQGNGAASMTGTGITRFDGALSITGTGLHDFNSGRTLLTTGTTTWTNGAGNGGQIRLGPNARVENRGLWLDNTSVSTSINASLGGGTFANTALGTFQKTTATTTTVSTVFANDGAVDVLAGTLVLSGGGSLNGSYAIGAGTTLELGGGTVALGSTSVGLNGRLLVSGGTVNQTGALTPSGSGLLELSSGTLNIGGSMDVARFNQSGGTLGGSGNLTVSGASILSTPGNGAATMTGTGTTRFNGALSITGSGLHDFTGGRTLLTTGTTTWTNATGNNGQIRMGSNARVENRGLWLDNTSVSTSINQNLGGGGSFVNTATGTYRKSTATTTTISSAMNNDGLVEIQAGTLDLSGGGTHSGDFVMSGTGELSVSSGTHNFLAASSIAGSNFTFAGATMNVDGSYDISGTTSVTGGTNSLVGANLLNLGTTLSISGGSLNLGAHSPTLTTFNQSGGSLSGTGTVTVSGASTLSTPGNGAATMTGTGTTRFNGALSITDSGVHDFTGGRTLLTTGTTTWTNAAGNNGQIRMGSNARVENRGLWLDNTSVSTSINSNFGGGGTFVNTATGTYRKSTATTTTISSALNNDGLVEVQQGNLLLSGGGSLSGSYAIASGATLELGGGTFAFNTTTVGLDGRLLVSGGTVNQSGDLTPTGNGLLELTGGTLNIADSLTVVNFTHSAGTLSGAGDLTVSGDGVMATPGNGAVTMTGTGTTRFDGALSVTGTGLHDLNNGRTLLTTGITTWTNGAGNTGQFRLGPNARIENRGLWLDNTSVSTFISAGLGGGTFVNTATGTYRKTGATTVTVSTELDNLGTIDVQNGTFTANGNVVQQAGSTLTGGTWRVSGNGVLQLNELGAVNFTTNQGGVTLDGANASFARINTLTNNQGAFRLLGNRDFTAVGAFNNSGVLQLGGGTFNAPGLTNTGTGQIFGFGTITPAVINSGTVRASGGTLIASNGIDGQSGTIQTDAGATLALGANSDGDRLVNNGTLALGTSNVTVAVDYTNDNFGTGNSFNARANVTGTGQILASGNVGQALTGAVDVGATDTPSIAFGNIHVGDIAQRQFAIANTGTSGPALRGALQTTVNGGNITDTRLSGSGVTADNFGPILANSASGNFNVFLTGSSAGALSGQAVAVVNNFDNVAEQVLSISGAVYRYANPTAHTPEPVNFGNRRVGDVVSQNLTLGNDVPNDGFSESLDATIGGVTGDATSNDGSFAVLAAGATDNSSLAVGLNTASAGHKTGTATITLASNGAGTSELGLTALGTQTVNVSGDVFRLASASAHTPEPVVFANRHVGDVASQALSLTNTAANDGFSERLNASIGGVTGNATSNGGSFALLGAGASDGSSLSVGIDTSSAGRKTGTATISLASDGTGTSGFAALGIGTQTVNISGDVYRLASASAHTPEPINFGNRRVGDVTSQALSLSNNVVNDGFSESLDATIGGVTGNATSNGGSFSLLGAGATNNSNLAVGIDTASAGHKTGTATITLASNGAGTSNLGISALGTQTVNVSGDVFRLASASGHTPEPVVFANRHVGDAASQALSLTNTAANDGFSERLNASIGGVTGNATSNGGSFALLGAGASDGSSLSVGIDTSSAGRKTGTATISLASDGTGTSGFAALGIGTQTVNVSGDVYRLASASTIATVQFGNVHVGDVVSQALSLTNTAAADGFSESLDAVFTGASDTRIQTSGSVSGLAAGASNDSSLVVGLDTSVAGSLTGFATVAFTSNGTGSSGLGLTALGSQNVGVTTNVAVYRFADGELTNTQPVDFGAHRVGDVVANVDVGVRNAAINDGFSEALNASVASVDTGFTASGAADLVAAGATSSGDITVGLDTSTAGVKSGNARLSYVSDGTGTSELGQTAIAGEDLAMSGRVYAQAVASVETSNVDFGIVHVGDLVGPQGVTVRNVALGSLTDNLLGSVSAVPAGFTGTGTLGAAGLAQGAASAALSIGLDTSAAGVFNGSASLAFVSHNAEMADLSLGDRTVTLTAQVNNYANPTLTQAAGDGTLSALAGGAFVFDFGRLTAGDSGVTGLLALTNFVTGPADTLGADFDIDGGSFALGQFDSFSGLAAGGAHDLTVGFNPLVVGLFEQVVRINLFGENASGYHGTLGTFELTLRADVQAVPVPGAVWLFGSALAGIAGLRRRRKAA